MKNTYLDLIRQTYSFPRDDFAVRNDFLSFQGISLKDLIAKYGTPFKLAYLPRIGRQINKARTLFENAFNAYDYKGSYQYCYCTKCNHFAHVVNEVVRHNVHLETSSAFDIDLIIHLEQQGRIDKELIIINNGYKTDDYLQKIMELHDSGFSNVIVVLDSMSELDKLAAHAEDRKIRIGLRMAINQEPQSSFNTSRLGIRADEILEFYHSKIAGRENLELKMLHFFVDSGIRDDLYYWGEFQRALQLYIELKRNCDSLTALNLGGGFPICNKLGFEYDYQHIANEITRRIKTYCETDKVSEPDIFTEFGKYTVGESGAIIFEVLESKAQNDNDNWYIIDNSLMTSIPDAWSLHEKFILLPVNKWNEEYNRAHIGGISCDHTDFYNSDDFNQEVLLPKHDNDSSNPLYLGFFNTGAYQDALSGYGGIKHCLIPSPQIILIEEDDNGNLTDRRLERDLSSDEMYRILGYHS